MKKEIKKGEQWRMGYQAGYSEASKAYGGCKECYGKGYATTLEFASGTSEWHPKVEISKRLPMMRFCSCSRGKQLKAIISVDYEANA